MKLWLNHFFYCLVSDDFLFFCIFVSHFKPPLSSPLVYLLLTISVHINPVKDVVCEFLCSHFLIFIPVDCSNGLWWTNKVSLSTWKGSGKQMMMRALLAPPLWCSGVRGGRCSHFHPHHTVWNTSAACAPSFPASPGSELPHTPWSLCIHPAATKNSVIMHRHSFSDFHVWINAQSQSWVRTEDYLQGRIKASQWSNRARWLPQPFAGWGGH